MGEGGNDRLYRFGLEPESAEKLGAEARAAEENGYPHGVSTFTYSTREDAASAIRTEVERHFGVVQTARNPKHHTVVLPTEVTDDVAELFNRLFGRLP